MKFETHLDFDPQDHKTQIERSSFTLISFELFGSGPLPVGVGPKKVESIPEMDANLSLSSQEKDLVR